MSDNRISPEFDDLADVFWRLGIIQSPSELQGRLVGWLAAGDVLTSEQWLDQALVFLDPVGEISKEDRNLFLNLHYSTSSQICDGQFNLELLLPEDTFDIRQRVESLAQWCKGFLTGFALAGKKIKQHYGQQQYSAELSETLNDMAAISKAGVGDEKLDLESSEQDFFDVTEYLRMAAISIYFECKELLANSLPRDLSPTELVGKNTLH